MKIGILTYHRAHNYGAVLQCYAMQETLKTMGHDAYVIDYRQPDIERTYRFHRGLSVKAILKQPILKIPSYTITGIKNEFRRNALQRYRKAVFEGFCTKYFQLTEPCDSNIPSDFDAYIIGSDMLWADDCMYGHFEPIYFGDFVHKPDAKVIGYAISGTPSSFKRCGEQTGFHFLENFTSCAIRERGLADIVTQYTRTETEVVVDPTLLTKKEIWMPLLNKKWNNKKYVLTYYVRVNASNRQYVENKAKEYAESIGCDVVNMDISLTRESISVEDFVSMIACAQYVITDSFHAMIFSMIFHRPFNVLKYNDPHDARYVDILNQLGVSNLAILQTDDFIKPDIDFDKMDENLQTLIASSEIYLQRSL